MYIRIHIKQILWFSLLNGILNGIISHITQNLLAKKCYWVGSGEIILMNEDNTLNLLKPVKILVLKILIFKNTHFFFLFYHCFSHLEFYNKILALLFYKHFFQMFCFLMYMFLNILNFTILLLLWGYLLIHIYGVRQQNILKLLITHF